MARKKPVTCLLKEPIYAGVVAVQKWSPADLSEPFDLAAYLAGNASVINVKSDDEVFEEIIAHTYTFHDGDDTTQISVIMDETTEILKVEETIVIDGTEFL